MGRLIRSFGYAINGLRICLKQERNFQVHLVLASIAIVLAFVLGLSLPEKLVILLCIALVLSMELLNTAIEQLCNVVHPAQHPGIKAAKDLSAGAVLLSAVIAFVCGLAIFVPHLVLIFKQARI